MKNKKILAVLLAFATLTACDSLQNGEKDKAETEDTQVEESQDATDKKDADTDSDQADKDTDTDSDKDADSDSDNDTDTDADSDDDSDKEAVTDSGTSLKERLEDAIFNNRVQARAAEILIDTAGDSLTEENITDLESLIEESNTLIEKAEKILEDL